MLRVPVPRVFRQVILAALLAASPGVGATAVGSLPDVVAAQGPARQTTVTAPGTIAYVTNLSQLHLIQPDGSNDHVIWTEPPAGSGPSNYLLSPSWRPDSGEIAFESSHEQTASIYNTDIYGVAPNGSGLRRITNPPDASQYASFPKGSVRLTIVNHDLSDSVFLLYVAGAPQLQSTTVTAGNSAVVTFNNVAVFSGKAQFPVAIDGVTRWIGSPAQLSAGGTVDARIDVYAANGQDNYGARDPVWRSDGAELDDIVGQGCVGEAWPASAPPGATSSPLLQSAQSLCPFDRGRTAALAGDVLYWNYYDFAHGGDGELYQTTEGSSDPGTPMVDTGYSSFVYDLKYLPDGSGFLWTEKVNADDSSSNFYRYDFGSGNWTQLTHFTAGFANHFSISPDGQYVVFEHSSADPVGNVNTPTDLWLMKTDGTVVAQPFVTNAAGPAWSRGTSGPVGSHHVYLPAVFQR